MDMKSFLLGAVAALAVVSLSVDAQQANKPVARRSLKCTLLSTPMYMENSTTEKQLSEIIEELNTMQYELCEVVQSTSDTSAPGSWRDPAGESPAQVRGSARLVASVALWKATTTAKRTQRLCGVGY